MLEEIDKHALFHEIHRSIEETAAFTAREIVNGTVDILYPPNGGFTDDEICALRSVPRTAATESALRKVIANAAWSPLFHLFCLADGVTDAPELDAVQPSERDAEELPLHDGLCESYWAWRRRRPDPGWRLDKYDG